MQRSSRRAAEGRRISRVSTRLRAAGLALALAGAAITAYLTFEHASGAAPVCGIGHGCEVVADSSYARVGAVPTAAFGLLLYMLVALSQGMLLAGPPADVGKGLQVAAVAMSLVGAMFSGWLTYVEIAVLHAICFWCSMSAGTMLLLVVITVADFMRGPVRHELGGSRPDLACD